MIKQHPTQIQIYEEYTYLNINIINSKQNSASFFQNNPQIRFTDNFNVPLFENPKHWMMAINRFSTSSGSCLPIWTPEIVDNQDDPNLCVQNITLSCVVEGTTYSQTTNMYYVAESSSSYAPSNPSILSYDYSHYYYVYTVSHVVYLFNNMLQTCFNALQTQVGSSLNCECPFINYNPDDGLFSLYFDQTGTQFDVFFDANLYNMFYSFYFQNTNKLYINSNGLNTVQIGSTSYTKVTQDFISTSSWSPVQSVVFTTQKISIKEEITTLPNQFYDESNLTNSTQNPVKQKIITDFSIPYDKCTDARGYLTYTPNIMRWINMNSNTPLSDIDINVFFIDKNSGDLIPILLPNNSSCNLKLCFKKIYN